MRMRDDDYLLIVDDMRVICELLTDVLTAEGFAVQASMSGEQAIDAIRARTPALIIIDQVMPGKKGHAGAQNRTIFRNVAELDFRCACNHDLGLCGRKAGCN